MTDTTDTTDVEPVGLSQEELSTMEVRQIPLDQIFKNEWNPNTMDDNTFDRLVEELGEIGCIDPIQVVPLDDGTFRLLGGEHRVEAAKVLGWDSLPCVVLSEERWKDEDLQKFVTVRLNVLKGNLNPEKFLSLYNEMADKYGADCLQRLFAYTDSDAWNKVLKDVSKGLKASLPPAVAAKFDEVKGEIKTVEGLSAVLNELFTKYGNTLPYNFMVFTYGGRDHTYVLMDKSTKKALDVVLGHCTEHGKDLNMVIAPMLKKLGDILAEEPVVEPEKESVDDAKDDDKAAAKS